MARRETFPESLTELSREALIERALDLQQRLHQIDAERSTPGNLVLRRL